MVRQDLPRMIMPTDSAPQPDDEFGVWAGYHIPEDRARWHPLMRRLYDYWRSLAPLGRLPGRQNVVPEDIAPLWSRAWMLECFATRCATANRKDARCF